MKTVRKEEMKQFGLYIILPAMISLIGSLIYKYRFEVQEAITENHDYFTRFEVLGFVFITFVVVAILVQLSEINSKLK